VISFAKKQRRRDRFETIGPRRTFVKIMYYEVTWMQNGSIEEKSTVSINSALSAAINPCTSLWGSMKHASRGSPRVCTIRYAFTYTCERLWTFHGLADSMLDDYALLNSFHAIMHRIVDQSWLWIPVNAE